MQFELDAAEQIFNLADRQEDRKRNQAIQDFDRFAALENLQNVSASDIVQFSKKFPERSEEIARNLVQRQVSNI